MSVMHLLVFFTLSLARVCPCLEVQPNRASTTFGARLICNILFILIIKLLAFLFMYSHYVSESCRKLQLNIMVCHLNASDRRDCVIVLYVLVNMF